jgi:hypothetical protein
MTLGGDSDLEAVYAVSVQLGHATQAQRKRAPGDLSSQLMNLQIDLGSSDMVCHYSSVVPMSRVADSIVAGIRIVYFRFMLQVEDAVRRLAIA